MAVYQQQNSSQHFINYADAQQQFHSYCTTENFISNNPGRIEHIREDSRKIYIGGLEKETTQDNLREHFGQFGEIQYINVKVDAATGWCRGFAFLVYQTLGALKKALAHTNHVINGKKIELKKATPRRVKLFIGGLSPDLTPEEIIVYFRRFGFIVSAEMPYDRVTQQLRGFCFITLDNMRAVHKILDLQRHVIKGTQVDVKVALSSKHGQDIMPGASGYMAGMQRNIMGQGGFLPQSGYPPYDPGYYYGGQVYYTPCPGYSNNYSYSHGYTNYGYPSYVAGPGANFQYEAFGC